MENISSNSLPCDAPALLSRLARATLEEALLAYIHEATVYQIAPGWQREVLCNEAGMAQTLDLAAFEAAVADPSIMHILVPKDSSVMQNDAMNVLQANRLAKTIFWEVRSNA